VPTATATTVRDLINAELLDPDEPDPHALTDHVIAVMTDEQKDEVLRPGVLALVLEGIRLQRQRRRGDGSGGSGKGRSRRRRAHDELMQRFSVNGTWIFYGDCGVEDLLAIARDYRESSVQAANLAARFEVEARELRESPYSTIRELRESEN
jgi:hypothetical protein